MNGYVLARTKHICGCVTHFDEDRWTSVTDSQCEFHATNYPAAAEEDQ